ncbi:MAG: 4-hydroxy-tetrahydrodipicolinate synthase [Actinobacteria bacterium RBG_16_64_13]|nr:MAG: 4-hydroxy-tetrahydrodipicolinate synthase [Actinobacteria bacterium RBG_16_64_13]
MAKVEWGLRGVIVPLITPFKDDLSVDYPGLAELVDYCIEEMGCDGLVPCGTTGESTTLSHQEHVDVIRAVVRQTRDRVPVIASAGSNSTSEAVALTRLAEEVGAHATLQVGPYYNKPTQVGLFNHFVAIAAASRLPLIIYNIPGRTSRNVEPQTIARLWSEVPNVVGLKDCSNDLHQTMCIYRSTDPETFKIYCGEDIMTLSLLCHGGAGAIAAVAHVIGREVKAMCEAVWSGRLPEARDIHYRTMDIVDALFVEPNPTPVKQALEWLGLPAGPLRPPLETLTEAGQSVLRAAMQAGGWLS